MVLAFSELEPCTKVLRVPVVVFTALVGAPFFVYVMVRKKYGFGGN